jgi:hypothetical protein
MVIQISNLIFRCLSGLAIASVTTTLRYADSAQTLRRRMNIRCEGDEVDEVI